MRKAKRGRKGQTLHKIKLRVRNARLGPKGFACFLRPRRHEFETRHPIIIDIEALREAGLRGTAMKRTAISCLAHEIYHALEYEFGLPVSECATQKFTAEIERESQRPARRSRR